MVVVVEVAKADAIVSGVDGSCAGLIVTMLALPELAPLRGAAHGIAGLV